MSRFLMKATRGTRKLTEVDYLARKIEKKVKVWTKEEIEKYEKELNNK